MNNEEDNAPQGYHYEWKLDPAWRLGTNYTKCRQPRCVGTPIAEVLRHSFARNRDRWWAYCGNHLYGRRIVNNQVRHRILVKDSNATPV